MIERDAAMATGRTTGLGQATLVTKRLTLAPLRAEHADAVVQLFTDPAMSTHLGRDFADPAAAAAMVEQRLAYAGPKELGHWVFTHHDAVIGIGHLRPSWELPGALPEIGWYLGSGHGGQGLATEAAQVLLHHGLAQLGLNSVWALVHVDNAPSLRLATRVGFLPVGTGVHYGGEHRVHVALP